MIHFQVLWYRLIGVLILQDWVSILYEFNNTLNLIRMIALVVYDLILSFPMELKGIWKRRFGTGTILYLSIRYGQIVHMLLQVLASILVPGNLIVSI